MTKILVTGGCGFIGSNFIRYWLKKYPKTKIVNLDKLTYAGHLSSTRGFSDHKNYRFIKGDICNPKVVDQAVREIDVMVHFAAESHVDRSIKNPPVFSITNILGTQTLLDAALKHRVKRFHHVSTDEVFGSLPLNGKKFSETTRYDPHNPYSASKAASDHLVRAYHITYGLPITITNCSNNYGFYQDPEKMIPKSIISLIDHQFVSVYGNGENVRNWIFVEDHLRAIDLVLHKGRIGETYLVGNPTKDTSNLELARKLLEKFGLPSETKKGNPHFGFIKDRPGHDLRYAIDCSKIKRELGWRPKYDLDSGLSLTIEWYKNNEWWWRPLIATQTNKPI